MIVNFAIAILACEVKYQDFELTLRKLHLRPDFYGPNYVGAARYFVANPVIEGLDIGTAVITVTAPQSTSEGKLHTSGKTPLDLKYNKANGS